MVKDIFDKDHYYQNNAKNIFSCYYDLLPLLRTLSDVFIKSALNSSNFKAELFKVFSKAYFVYLDEISNFNIASKDLAEFEKTLKKRFHKTFDNSFREEKFVNLLSDTVASYSELAEVTGMGKMYQNLSNKFALWNNYFVESIRDTLYRTPSKKIYELEKYSLFHYDNNNETITTSSTIETNKKERKNMVYKYEQKIPVLVIYAFINRHYILDLLPKVSVIRNLLNQGLDIFATDWGTPSVYDKNLTIGHFINNYIDKSVDYIRRITKSDKVSLFGYCWGGDLALMYAALHPEKIKNLTTVATPGDSDLDDSLLSVWTRSVKEDYILDAFGNVPGMLLNSAFNLRRPIEYSHKYFHFFEQPHSFESIAEFFATETWLYDSPPVIGEIYREFVEYCYKQNLLIKNKMIIQYDKDNIISNNNDKNNKTKVIDLENITAPYLNVVAQKDDLVAPESSKALNSALTKSYDKKLIEFSSGHVGLMIGSRAHTELWPKVGQWIRMH
jgi:polyhydroxyalkanoate synthase subunit PhaC